MSFPFLLSLGLFATVLADVLVGGPGFISSAAYRAQPSVLAGLAILGGLIWIWVLVAARRRDTAFSGPIEDARGRNGVLQPILATVFLVIAVNLAYSHSIPRFLNLFLADDVGSEPFTLTADIAPYRSGCERVAATGDRSGAVTLCLPEGTAGRLAAGAGDVVVVTGSASWFGIEPRRYAVAGATGTPEPAATFVDDPGDPAADVGFDPPRDRRPSLDKLAQP
jgi:hypothetical protein